MSDVLAVAEHRRGELRAVSLELITTGRDLADHTGGRLHVAVVGGDVDAYADSLSCEGVDVVQTIDEGEEFNHDIYVQTLTQLATDLDPQVLLVPHTVNGMDYAPALATALDRPLVTDAVALEYADHLTATRELYGGKVEGTIEVGADRALVTVRPAEWPAATGTGDASIESFEATIDESAAGSTVTGFDEVAGGDVDISEADLLVSVGRGIDEEENLPLVEELAEVTGATISASRPIVDNGWLPKNRQVGQSGKTVAPDVYIAIGISGAVQHVAGMKGADTVIAINTDPDAPIFDVADYGIVGDLFEVVPELTAQFE